ncbi:MAG: HAMP domain-containing histidine kinase [Bacteroidales bacterium]|nr:HAMP domain-containing histidine kinase [Bacteroidales bacterium]
MGYKRVTFTTVINIAIILSAGFFAGILTLYYNEPWFLLILILAPLATYRIIYTFDQSNRQIAFFFEAIRNEDSALKFPTQIKGRSLRHLYRSLNELNEQIQAIKLKNEYLEKYYQSFIQHAAIGLIAINGENEVEIMNEKAFDYAGIPSFTPLHLIPLRNPDLFKTLCNASPGETVSYKRFTSESQMNLLILAREIRYGGKVSKLISLQDIRHELDEKELDSWQKLIRVLTHEIMNSIAPIVSLSGTLRRFFVTEDKPVRPEDIDEEVIENAILGLDTIEERGNGLLDFVNSYRRLTRIPKPDYTTIDIKEWLDQIRLLLNEQFDRCKINVVCTIDSKVKEIQGDEKLLSQVLINILNNAMDALAEKSSDRRIHIFVALSKQNRPLIRIANNGPVIPPDVADKIFIPFFTTKEQGSGIGLSLSRQILRLHHGSIHLESGEKETGFIITF